MVIWWAPVTGPCPGHGQRDGLLAHVVHPGCHGVCLLWGRQLPGHPGPGKETRLLHSDGAATEVPTEVPALSLAAHKRDAKASVLKLCSTDQP